MKSIFAQRGFTLIELMISVVIGLIIVAAITQIYVMSVRTGTTQRAAAGILDANVYGLQHMEKSLRMAGLGLSDSSKVNNVCGGILLATTGHDITNDTCFVETLNAVDNPFAAGIQFKHTTQVSLPSVVPNTTNTGMPQLTIQYRAPVDMRDCEGQLALGPRKVVGRSNAKSSAVDTDSSGKTTNTSIDADGQVIIERYFVALRTDSVNPANNVLELRCDAGRYITESITTDNHTATNAIIAGNATGAAQSAKDGNRVIGLEDKSTADSGSLIIAGIDDFQVQLGMKSASGIQYRSIRDVVGKNDTSEIVAIKMAVLARGIVSTTAGDIPVNPTYNILGQEVSLRSGQNTNFIRRVYESSTMLRNSRGES